MIKKKKIVSMLGFAIAAGAFIATPEPVLAAKNDKPMNVLFLVSDDMNSLALGDTNRYTGKVIAPNLNKLAQDGVSFKYAYAAAPVCSPSRTAFFSGVAPWKSGIYNNAQTIGASEPLNNAEVLSLAGMFKKSGYSTFKYGKITHGWDQKYWDDDIGHKRDPAPPGHPLAKLCGLKPPAYLDGRSLVPLLKDPKAPWESTAITGLCTKGLQDGVAFISIRHELGRYTRYGADQEEYYDSNKDPHEWNNQINNPEYAANIKKLRTLVPSFENTAKPLPSALTPGRRESQKEKKITKGKKEDK